jgi:hypothetical protein
MAKIKVGYWTNYGFAVMIKCGEVAKAFGNLSCDVTTRQMG